MKILILLAAQLFVSSTQASVDCRKKGVAAAAPRWPEVSRQTELLEAHDALYRELCKNLKTPNRFFRGYRAHPSPKYVAAYLWDTAFIAQAWMHWDPKIAQELIRYLLRFQKKSGIVHHAVLELLVKPFPYADSQPPLLAWTSWRIFQRSQDLAFLRGVYPGLKRYHEWLKKNRRHPDGLYFWKHPYESGIDNSPRFTNRSESWMDDTTKLASVDISSYMAQGMESLEKIARVLGYEEEALNFAKEYAHLKRIMNETFWDETDGTYYDYDYRRKSLLKIDTVSSFTPLVAGIPDAPRARRLIERALDPARYNTLIPFPSVSRADPRFVKDMWRGPVWINMAYYSVLGVDRYGYHAEAAMLARKISTGVYETWKNRGTFYEFYDPERFDIKELHRKKGNLWKQIQLGSKPVNHFAGWTALANALVQEFGKSW